MACNPSHADVFQARIHTLHTHGRSFHGVIGKVDRATLATPIECVPAASWCCSPKVPCGNSRPHAKIVIVQCRSDGIGSHARLKIVWAEARAGSTPASGTNLSAHERIFYYMLSGRGIPRHGDYELPYDFLGVFAALQKRFLHSPIFSRMTSMLNSGIEFRLQQIINWLAS